MKSSGKSSPVAGDRRLWIILVRVLSGAGLGLSAYLLWGSITQGYLPGCGFESGCNAVLHSRWASWFGVLVGGFAVMIYALVLGGSWILPNSADLTGFECGAFLLPVG